MSTFAKKVTSAVAALSIVFSIVSPLAGVSAAYTSLDAANKLATLGVIVDQSSNPADYRLGDNLPRKEAVKVMMNLSSVAVVDNCEGKFEDLSSSDWACKYAETALANGMVAANANFDPDRLLSNIEGLKMVFQGRDLSRNDNADWRAGYVDAAVEMGIASAFTDYDSPVTRGQFFIWAANAVDQVTVDNPNDILCEILGTCDTPTDPTDPTDPTTPTTPVVGDMLQVSLSPSTPDAATLPQNISGVPVAAFDFTAGNSDVTLNSLVVQRAGLSNATTLTGLAAFTDEGRASKAKDDTQNNNTEATLTLDNGGIVVMAGETVTVTIVADIAGGAADEFAIELIDVTASSTVDMDPNLMANTMKVGGVSAETLTVQTDGTFSDPKIGEAPADLFKFRIKGSNIRDLVLNQITFKGEGSIDEETELENYRLLHNGTEVASVAMANGKYITFVLDGGLVIPEDQTEKFSVQADVVGGAGKTIAFKIDRKLDVRGEDTLYGYGTNVVITAVNDADGSTTGTNELGIQTVQAGEITLADIDAANDKIRANKTNVELGSINVTNVSGNNLELQKFGVDVTLSNVGSFAGGLAGTFENFEAVINGTSYELLTTAGSANTGTYGDTDLSIALPQGTTTIVLRADTKQGLPGNMKVDISLTNIASQFYVVELGDDKQVTDLTPSSLSWKQLEVLTATATASVTPTANATVVRGSKDIVANVFTLKASQASDLTMDEVKAKVTMNSGTVNAATSQEVAKVTLYKDAVAAGNVLDQVSGSQLAAGVATFNGFTLDIAKNETKTFVVTVDFVDSASAVTNTDYITTITSISLADDDSNDVFIGSSTSSTLASPLQSTSQVAVTNAGSFTVAYDATNTANDDAKTLLAGTSNVVASYDVEAQNEAVDVETVKVKVTQNNAVTAVQQVDTYTIGGTFEAGDIFTIILNGVSSVHTATVWDANNAGIATQLTSLINAAPNGVSASSSGAVITVFDTIPGTWITHIVQAQNGTGNVANDQSITFSVVTPNTPASAATPDTNFASAFASARLLLDGQEVGTAVNSDYNATTGEIAFTNLTNLIIPTQNVELEVEITTSPIGFEKVGKKIASAIVDSISLETVTGASSGKPVTQQSTTADSKVFAVTDVVLTPTVVAMLDTGTAQVKIVADAGANTQATSNATPLVTLQGLAFTNNGTGVNYKVYEDGKAAPASFSAIANYAVGGSAVGSITSISFTDQVTVNVLPEGIATLGSNTYTLELNKNGITYNTGGSNVTNNMTSPLSLGTKTY